MQRSFAITTRQAARLRGVEPHKLYSHFKRHGNWEGVVPSKLPNGRLLWARDEILRAAGLVQLRGAGAVDIRVFLECLEAFGLPTDDAALCAFGARALCHDADHRRDAAYMLEELAFHVEAGMAAASRLEASLNNMSATDIQRAQSHARMMAGTWSWLLSDEFTENTRQGGKRNADL